MIPLLKFLFFPPNEERNHAVAVVVAAWHPINRRLYLCLVLGEPPDSGRETSFGEVKVSQFVLFKFQRVSWQVMNPDLFLKNGAGKHGRRIVPARWSSSLFLPNFFDSAQESKRIPPGIEATGHFLASRLRFSLPNPDHLKDINNIRS